MNHTPTHTHTHTPTPTPTPTTKQELKTSTEELLEAVGYWFVVYVKSTVGSNRIAFSNSFLCLSLITFTRLYLIGQPYGKVLSMVGDSMAQVLDNINTMHGHIKLAHFKEVPSSSCLACCSRKH